MDGQIEHVYILGMDEQVARIIIPAGVTILVFVFTQFVVWWRGQVVKRREIVAYREMILKWGELVEPHVEQQIEGCRAFVKRIGELTTVKLETFNANGFFVDKVEAIGLERYMNSLVINVTGQAAYNYKYAFELISQFGYLKTREKGIPERYEHYKRDGFRIKEEWGTHLEALLVLYADLSASESSDYRDEVVGIFESQEGSAARNYLLARKSLTKPWSEIKVHPSTEIEKKFFYANLKVYKSGTEWERLNEAFVKGFEKEAMGLGMALVLIREAAAYFEGKTKVKSVWRIR